MLIILQLKLPGKRDIVQGICRVRQVMEQGKLWGQGSYRVKEVTGKVKLWGKDSYGVRAVMG